MDHFGTMNDEDGQPNNSHDDVPYWTESALDWFDRCDDAQRTRIEPTDPISAAHSFVEGETTGLAFLDEALIAAAPASAKKKKSSANASSIVEITGSDSVTTTGTLLSLAARFVVATRPSKFPASTSSSPIIVPPPQVVLIDSLHNISIERLVSMVRGTLLLDSAATTGNDTTDVDPSAIDLEINDCLSRIHLVFVHDTTTTVAALEALKCCRDDDDTSSTKNAATLLLWDGFLSSLPDATARMEVLRQLGRLWREKKSMLLIALFSNRPRLENKHVTSRVRLERASGNDEKVKYAAMVGTKRFDFTMGTAGVLSLK